MNVAKAEQVTSWKSADGQLWDSEEKANTQNRKLAYKDALEGLIDKIGGYSDFQGNLRDAIQTNAQELYDMLLLNDEVKRADSDPDITKLLQSLEWSGAQATQDNYFVRSCPCCKGIDESDPRASHFMSTTHGHRSTCQLAWAIASRTR